MGKGGQLVGVPSHQPVMKRRLVECGMAWELDCVACGIVPMDGEYVAVIGLVSAQHDDEQEKGGGTSGESPYLIGGAAAEGLTPGGRNFLELQIISQTAGTVTSLDALSLLAPRSIPPHDTASTGIKETIGTDAVSSYHFVSSYWTPVWKAYSRLRMSRKPGSFLGLKSSELLLSSVHVMLRMVHLTCGSRNLLSPPSTPPDSPSPPVTAFKIDVWKSK